MRPHSPTGLYWSIRGEVACEDHAPQFDDPRWSLEGWTPLPVLFGRARRRRYQCQHCVGDGRTVTHLYSGVH